MFEEEVNGWTGEDDKTMREGRAALTRNRRLSRGFLKDFFCDSLFDPGPRGVFLGEAERQAGSC